MGLPEKLRLLICHGGALMTNRNSERIAWVLSDAFGAPYFSYIGLNRDIEELPALAGGDGRHFNPGLRRWVSSSGKAWGILMCIRPTNLMPHDHTGNSGYAIRTARSSSSTAF